MRSRDKKDFLYLPLSEGVNRGETIENKIISKNTIIKITETRRKKKIHTH